MQVLERRSVLGANVERMLIDLYMALEFADHKGSCMCLRRTFFSLARKKLLTRNLKRSSSVWMTMSLKFVFGSILPV